MEREVARLLQDAGDPAAALVFGRACRELDGPLRVAVLAREPALAARLAGQIADALPTTTWIALPIGLGDPGDEAADEAMPDDRLLAVHAVVWATPVTAALGAEERHLLERLPDLGAPADRVVTVCDTALLERVSDDPERELGELRARLETVRPRDWALVEQDGLEEWARGLQSRLAELRRTRREEVARLLVEDALDAAREALGREEAALGEIEALLAREDESLARALRQGERTAAHVLGAMRRQMDGLRVDVRTLLTRLEQDLPAQIAAIDDVDLLRRVLPHWLQHVVTTQLADRLAEWRAAVLADLAEVGIDDAEALRAELLVPALHAPPLRGEGGWRARLAVTAAIGGGAAMLLAGLWVPGAVALSGGLLWSGFTGDTRATRTREALLDSARTAIRRMAEDAERLLADQIAQIEADLAHLGEDRLKELEHDRAEARSRLVERRAFHRARIEPLRATIGSLRSHLGTP